MRHPLCLLLAASVALTGSDAEAKAAKTSASKASQKKGKAPAAAIEDDEEVDMDEDDDVEVDLSYVEGDDEDADDDVPSYVKKKRVEKKHKRAKKQTKEVAFAEEAEEPVDAPLTLSKRGITSRRKNAWNFAVGPYVWASAVEANVTVGAATVAQDIDFMTLSKRGKYGAMVAAEARYGKLAITGDLNWGVLEVKGQGPLGPLMVGLDGTVNNLALEGGAGYRVYGDDSSLLSAEARVGVRYQRTAISGTLDLSGNVIPVPDQITSSTDGTFGGRIFVHPLTKLFVTGTFDYGVAGDSAVTYSVAVDVSYRPASFLLATLGYRRLTNKQPGMEITMTGPRLALQLTF